MTVQTHVEPCAEEATAPHTAPSTQAQQVTGEGLFAMGDIGLAELVIRVPLITSET